MKSFLAGFAIGLGTGLLLAPAPGSETRRKIADMLDRTADKVKASSTPIVDAVRSQVERIAENEYGSSVSQEDVSEIENTHLLNILNSASKTHLMKVPGIGEATARRIIEGRPYTDMSNVIDDHILREEVFEKLKKLAIEEAEEGAA